MSRALAPSDEPARADAAPRPSPAGGAERITVVPTLDVMADVYRRSAAGGIRSTRFRACVEAHGDSAARAMGFTPLGLGERAGYRHAVALARRPGVGSRGGAGSSGRLGESPTVAAGHPSDVAVR